MPTKNISLELPQLYPWQQQVLDSPAQFKLLCISRQGGKTTVAIDAACEEALKGNDVLWTSPVYKELINPFRITKKLLRPITTKTNENEEVRLETGGTIFFRSANDPDGLRGPHYNLVVSDEMAFGDEAVFEILSPTLIRQKGKFLGLSTPNGFNHFFDLWDRATKDPDWFTLHLPWHQCPGLDPKAIEKERKNLARGAFRQEYEAEFVSPKDAIFDPDQLRAAMITEKDWPKTGFSRSCLGVDPSLGRELGRGDWQAISFVGVKDGILYCDCYAYRVQLDKFCEKIKQLYVTHKPEMIALDAQGFQEAIQFMLMPLFDLPPHIEMMTGNVDKETRISRLASLLGQGRIKVLDTEGGKMWFRQMSDFPKKNRHDDIPDSIVYAWEALAK